MGKLVVRPMRRFVNGLAVAAVSGALVFGGSLIANADPDTVEQAQAQLDSLQEAASAIDQQYSEVQVQLDASQTKLAQTQSDLQAQESKVGALKSQVSQVALQTYRSQNVGTTTALLVSEDVDGFLSQLSTVERVQATSNQLLQDLQTEQANLSDIQRDQAATVAQITADNDRLAALDKESDDKVAAAQAVLDRLTVEEQARLAAAQAAAAAAQAARLAAQEAASAARTTSATVRSTTTTQTGTASAAAVKVSAPVASDGSKASAVVAFALAQVGKSYSMGATGPNSYDCSGLTSAAFRTVGVGLPRVASSQFGVGQSVSLSQLQPGDLVFYYSGISHVGIYIGNGQIVHAANPRSGVTTASVTSMPFQGGRRVL